MSISLRLQTHRNIQTELSKYGDTQLSDLLISTSSETTSNWAVHSTLEVGGHKVFVKRIALSKLEYNHPMSTANLFNLPVVYQYGVGSRGFGAWRELVAHMITTDWVLNGQIQNFPLLYHHRVLPRISPPKPKDGAVLEKYMARWDNNEQIRERELATDSAVHELVLFIEYFPHVLVNWIDAHMADAAKMKMLFDDAWKTFDFMKAQGMVHFDAHLNNILTDGEHLYFADLGLVSCDKFELSKEEQAFLKQHAASYDYALFALGLFPPLKKLAGLTPEKALALMTASDVEAQANVIGVPVAFSKLMGRFGKLSAIMAEFFDAIMKDKSTLYPQDKLEKALSLVG